MLPLSEGGDPQLSLTQEPRIKGPSGTDSGEPSNNVTPAVNCMTGRQVITRNIGYCDSRMISIPEMMSSFSSVFLKSI